MKLVIVHPEWGVYLGNCFGLGFWSKIDPVGQPAAVCFGTEAEAEGHMRSWECERPPVTLHPVEPDQEHYASIAACVRAGLEGWIDEQTPTEGVMQ